MKEPLHKQFDAHPADSDPPLDSVEFDNSDSAESSPAQPSRLLGICLMGLLAVILLSSLAYFLVIRPQGQNAGALTASSSDQTAAVGGALVNATGLNLEAQHPDGTVLRVEGIAFDADKTTVQLTVINTRNPGDGLIRLNQSWGSIRSTMILKDGFGGEYPMIAAGGNSVFEVKPGQTITREFAFRGKMNPATQIVTLVTNSKGGAPSNPMSQTPLIEVKIPVSHTSP